MSAPTDVARALASIEARLEKIERRLGSGVPDHGAVGRLSAFGVIGDVVDDIAADLAARGQNPAEVLRAAKELALVVLRVDTLVGARVLVESAREAPRAFAALVDTLDDQADASTSSGVDLRERGRSLVKLFARLSSPETTIALNRLLDSGLLDPGALNVVSALGRSLESAAHGPSNEVGPLGLLGAIRDGDVKRALGFAVELAKNFGGRTRKLSEIPMLTNGQGDDHGE